MSLDISGTQQKILALSGEKCHAYKLKKLAGIPWPHGLLTQNPFRLKE